MTGSQAALAAIATCLVIYCLTGGADFGAGVWDLLASGQRRQAQRRAIERAIAPIWEVNHIWMIVVVVLLFTAFPEAFAAITVALHIPITLALVGIVMRGAAFVFGAYGLPSGGRGPWARVFAWASLLTPIVLGTVVAGLSSGDITLEAGAVSSGYLAGWATPLGALLGLFALALFSLLAACYLARETAGDSALAEDFRARALWSEAVAGALAAAAAWRAGEEAPQLVDNLLGSSWSLGVQLLTALSALAATLALIKGRYRWAGRFAQAQVALVVVGWGLSMDEHLILPALPIGAGGTRAAVLEPLLWTLAVGASVLLPALVWLFSVFRADSRTGRRHLD